LGSIQFFRSRQTLRTKQVEHGDVKLSKLIGWSC
jgi:hypothetical protein